jgi:hypothetical protein
LVSILRRYYELDPQGALEELKNTLERIEMRLFPPQGGSGRNS